jgi:hypothetical protein
MIFIRWRRAAGAAALTLLVVRSMSAEAGALDAAAASAARTLVERHGEAERARIERGVAQAARYWRAEDGDAAAFEAFVRDEFIPRGPRLEATFARFEFALERVNGYLNSLNRDLKRGVDLDIGEILPLDRRLAGWDVAAHVPDDLFSTKVAFVGLVNFPLTSLDARLREGGSWSRRQWAEARLAQAFARRVPADVAAEAARAYTEADAYIGAYNVLLHHVLTRDGRRLFPPGLRLITHWNLRDELKAQYAASDGLPRQRLIARVMEAIVRQEIPEAVIDNPLLDWTPETGAVAASPVKDLEPPPGKGNGLAAQRDSLPQAAPQREPDTRYRRWLDVFQAERRADPYWPDAPTFVERRFNVDREIPETEVRALFEALLTSPVGARAARLVAKRLGRPLEPFDIWYAGFKPRAKYTEAQLDALTKRKYPTPEAYAADMPRLLTGLGFSPERARFLSERIVVDPSRGAGHASGAQRRDDQAHLRTRVGSGGMDYKGYNIAVHEMGHNVEQVFSVTTIDHTLLMGVPNNAFTEALAFVFQARDLELLGLGGPDPQARHLRALEEFWAAREIAAVALVDMDAWRWLYAHPDATPAQLREAVVRLSQDVWNRHFAPLFETRDVTLLGIYSHLVSYGLYMPDYPLGRLIAFQIERHFERSGKPLGEEFERLAQQGRLTPDAWMRQGVGAPLSAQPLLDAAAEALDALEP